MAVPTEKDRACTKRNSGTKRRSRTKQRCRQRFQHRSSMGWMRIRRGMIWASESDETRWTQQLAKTMFVERPILAAVRPSRCGRRCAGEEAGGRDGRTRSILPDEERLNQLIQKPILARGSDSKFGPHNWHTGPAQGNTKQNRFSIDSVSRPRSPVQLSWRAWRASSASGRILAGDGT